MPLPLVALGVARAAGGFLRALPLSVYLIAGVAGVWGVREWQHARTENALRSDNAAVTVERDAANTKVGRLEGALDRMTANRDDWQRTSERQSAEIQQLQVTRKLVEQTAALAAVRVLQSSKATLDDLRSPNSTIKPGPDETNRFLTELEAGGVK